ncbi:MAG: recombinase family protein [Candidatus Bathyarchaeota archaeon]|uniref:recombinase family protein n=1 Tax=Candidatus Bathycorpusculum sp. TaxID=2994959 RepID=UPI002830FA92|nr:recombinase family protein [Candidatus Termiticorpusculum sp.]
MINDYLTTYNAALYLRLSKEDEINKQSESITNQRDFLTKYVLEQGWNIAGVYIDDGYSGLNYDRPDFKRMLADIEKKNINLVITKDLSRLGRDYIDTGYYLERYFPTQNVRYVALNDGIDTMADMINNDISPFKAVINDMYAKDISKKVRACFKTKQETGQFIGSFAPHGYIKDPNNNNRLLIDEETAGVIRRIYALYLSGKSTVVIAEILNDEGVECPSAYKKRVFPTYKTGNIKYFLWNREKVKTILQNPTYCGNLTQRKMQKISYKVDKKRLLSPKDWVTAEATHEGIISVADFDSVQILLRKKSNNYAKRGQRNRLLNGLLFCKECGGKMTYRGNAPNHALLCLDYSRYGLKACHSNKIREDIVEKYVIDELRKISKQTLKGDFCEQFSGLKPQEQANASEEIKQVKAKLDNTRQIIKNLYVDKLNGIIDESILLEVSRQYSVELQQLQRRLAELEQQQSRPATQSDYKELIKQLANFDVVDKSILMKLIDKIEISKDKEIFITYNFKNPFIHAEKHGQT